MSENTQKKVLLVIPYNVERGGVQSVLLPWVKNVSGSVIQFDWYFGGNILDQSLYDEISQTGIKLFVGNHGVMKISYKHPLKYFRYLKEIRSDINKILDNEQYDIIHINNGEIVFPALISKIANTRKIKCIVHSHSTGALVAPFLKKILQIPFRKAIICNANKFVAPSEIAAKAMFGEKYYKNARIIPNFISTKRFSFSEEVRGVIREKYNLDSLFVIGQIARLSVEKNQKFLIDIFKEVSQIYDFVKLILVGTGPLEKELKDYVKKSGLEEKVIFVGATDRPQDYYCAMDMFVLTSIYEGLSLSTVEAQTSGLRCIIADSIPMNAKLTDLVEYVPLSYSSSQWAEILIKHINKQEIILRKSMWLKIVEAGYDESNIEKELISLYETV